MKEGRKEDKEDRKEGKKAPKKGNGGRQLR